MVWPKDDLREFDYGPEKNLKLYGQRDPPKIDYRNVEKAEVPIALYIPADDGVVPPRWQRRLREKFPKVVVEQKEIQNCNHNCF